MTQNVRRRDAAQGARLTWLLTVPVALSLVLLFLSIPQSKYKSQDQLENIQDTVLEWVDKLPYIDISSDGEISLSLTKQISDTINLQSIGPNTQLGTRVMEVTAETSSRLYLRGRDYNIYTGTSWESTSGRSDTFSALSQSFLSTYDMDLFSAEELSIRTFGSHSVKYFPYYPAKAIRLVGGAFDNSSDSTAYSYQWYNLPSDYENYVTEHWHFLQEGNLDYITDDVLYGNTQILSSYYSSPFYNTARLYYLNLPDATADWAAY